MKRTNIYLEEEQSRLLRHLAIEEGRSFTDIVREALASYLAQRGLSSQSRQPEMKPGEDWRTRFDAVLAQIQSRVPADMTPGEIEAAITAASEDVRRMKTRRRAAAVE